MTTAQTRAHKIGNQVRKRKILMYADRHGKKSGPSLLGGIVQDGKYTEAAGGFFSRFFKAA